MMRELGPTSRALVAAARDGLGPDAATAARVRAKLAAALGASASLGAGTTHSVLAPVRRTTPVAAKLGLVLGVVTALAVIGALVHSRSAPLAGAPAVTPASSGDELRVDRVSVPEPSVPAPATVAPRTVTAPRQPATLAREVELVDHAMTELRFDNAAAALSLIAIYERETFGRGQLAEDAAAIELEALCTESRDVVTKLAAFDRRWPSSAQHARIAAACGR